MGYIPKAGAVLLALDGIGLEHIIDLSRMMPGKSYIVLEVFEGSNETMKALRLIGPEGKPFRTLFQMPASFDHMFAPISRVRTRKK